MPLKCNIMKNAVNVKIKRKKRNANATLTQYVM